MFSRGKTMNSARQSGYVCGLSFCILIMLKSPCAFGLSAEHSFSEPEIVKSAAIARRFGVFPLHNPVHLAEIYLPFVDALNEAAPELHLRFESSAGYAAYEEKILKRELDFAIINPYQAMVAERRGYHVFAKMGDDFRMRGIIVVRKDSNIHGVRDLRGHRIAFPSTTAMAATIMNKVYLQQHGLNVEREMDVQYVNSQDSAILNVHAGLTVAGGTWPPAWDDMKARRPDIIKDLEIFSTTSSIPNLAVVARDDIPAEQVEKLAKALAGLNATANGRKVLSGLRVSSFEPAGRRTYLAVEPVIQAYRSYFGKLPLQTEITK